MHTAFKVLRSHACDVDLEAIFDFLFVSYQELGDAPDDAFERAAERVLGIETTLEALGEVPFQGTLEPAIMVGLRHVTRDRAVFYFTVDEGLQELHVLAVFFGGQDHRAHLLQRIRAGEI